MKAAVHDYNKNKAKQKYTNPNPKQNIIDTFLPILNYAVLLVTVLI